MQYVVVINYLLLIIEKHAIFDYNHLIINLLVLIN